MGQNSLSPKETAMVLNSLVSMASTVPSRSSLANRRGYTYGTDRDMYASLGYPTTDQLDYGAYLDKFQRGDIATRIIRAFPEDTWKDWPNIVVEGPSKVSEQVRKLEGRTRLRYYLYRADVLAGIGDFAVMLIGLDDGRKLADPVAQATQITYLSCYGQNRVRTPSYVTNPANPRFGLPEYYEIRIANKVSENMKTEQWIRVHPDRILHVVDEATDSDVKGEPRLRKIWNRLLDVDKLTGGSAEMFWRGAFPGFGFIADAEADFGPDDESAMEDEIEEYVHGLKRYIQLQGISIQELRPQSVSPKSHFDIQIDVIAAATGIPRRILLGSEAGQLASEDDRISWNTKIQQRRNLFADPVVVRPLISRFADWGLIDPVEDYETEWPDLYTLSDTDSATIAQKISRALADYAKSPYAAELMPPEIFFREVLKLNKEIVEKLMSMIDEDIVSEIREAEGDLRQYHSDELEEQTRRDVDSE
jgi:uncharacterized protein